MWFTVNDPILNEINPPDYHRYYNLLGFPQTALPTDSIPSANKTLKGYFTRNFTHLLLRVSVLDFLGGKEFCPKQCKPMVSMYSNVKRKQQNNNKEKHNMQTSRPLVWCHPSVGKTAQFNLLRKSNFKGKFKMIKIPTAASNASSWGYSNYLPNLISISFWSFYCEHSKDSLHTEMETRLVFTRSQS